jgi:hypothetical protein
MSGLVCDFDDFGANHVISDLCQSHDCRDQLDRLHYENEAFKVTLFTIPGECTAELLNWCKSNEGWVQLAVHGWYHTSNYECEKMTRQEFQQHYDFFKPMLDTFFVKGFKAPGWQISDDIYDWLLDNGWWVADQDYNTDRRPKEIPAYINRNGTFFAHNGTEDRDWVEVEAWHGHTWDCVGNGIYETYDHVADIVRNAKEFHFVSEVLN